MNARRRFFQDAAVFGAGLLGLSKTLAARPGGDMGNMQADHAHSGRSIKAPSRETKRGLPSAREPFLPMVTPDVPDLPHEMDGGVKVFKLVAEPMKRKIAPFKTIDVWGYNASC